MSRLAMLTQLDERTWSTVGYQELGGRAMTVVFAYGIIAWNRYGFLGITEPKAPVRLVLIGVYSWFAMSGAVWIGSHVGDRRPVRLREAAIATAIAHIPLVTLGFFIAIVAGFARILGPGLIVSMVVFGAWMPALLIRAFRDVAGLRWPSAAGAGAVVHLVWLATTGRFLHSQVGHLL